MGWAQDAFKVMLRDEIAPALRQLGLRGSGQTFSLPSKTHWALVGFQKSDWSDSRQLRFTINLTVVSHDAWEAARSRFPEIGDHPVANGDYALPIRPMPGYWHIRIGRLLPGDRDRWWDLGTGTDVAQLATEVMTVIREHVLPAMQARLTEA